MPASQVGHHPRTLGQHQQNLQIEIKEVERKPAEAKKLLIDLGNRILGN